MRKLHRIAIISTLFLLPLINVSAKEYNKISINEFVNSINNSTLLEYESNNGTDSKYQSIKSTAELKNNLLNYSVLLNDEKYTSVFKYDVKENTLTYTSQKKRNASDISFEESIIDLLSEATGTGTNKEIVDSLVNFDYGKCDVENLGYCVQENDDSTKIIVELSDKMATEVLKLKSKISNKTTDERFQSFIDLANNSQFIKSINEKDNGNVNVYGTTIGNEGMILLTDEKGEELIMNLSYNPELNTIKMTEETDSTNSFSNVMILLFLYFEKFSTYTMEDSINSLVNTMESNVCDIENKGICVKYINEEKTKVSVELELTDKAVNNYFSKLNNKTAEETSEEKHYENPETGAFINYGLISLISAIAILTIVLVIKKKKFYNI